MNTSPVIIGGGLAGCECALQLAQAGIAVRLYEQKPHCYSPAHSNPDLAELVCSNSLRSDELSTGVGLLKMEMRALGSAVMQIADKTRVPAGKALAVDRDEFARSMTAMVHAEPLIEVIRQELYSLDAPELEEAPFVVLAAGPLASEHISASLARYVGAEHLYFYDAIAPIITAESVNMDVAFWASRYAEDKSADEGDYLNCPMNREEYETFYTALLAAQKVEARDFEKEQHFEGCMPIEALAERGERTLLFGPLKPVGITDPRTGRWPHAVVQLRVENRNKSMFNLVGCQTKLTYAEQDRIFRMIPGLENAVFARHGSMHRNTYVNAPQMLAADGSLKKAPHIFLAGQISGVEGYLESAASGLWTGKLLAARHHPTAPRELTPPPVETALGALLTHLRTPVKKFQPSNVNFGLMPELPGRARKKDRKALYSQRAQESFKAWRERTEGEKKVS